MINIKKFKITWPIVFITLLNIVLIALRIGTDKIQQSTSNLLSLFVFIIITATLLILLLLKKYDYYILTWLSFYFAAPIIVLPSISIGSLGLFNGIFIPIMLLIVFNPKNKYFLLISALLLISILNLGTDNIRLIISRIFEFIAPLLFFYFVTKKCKNPQLLIFGAIFIALINMPLVIYEIFLKPEWGSLADWRGIRIFGNLFWHNSYSIYLLPLILILYGEIRKRFSKTLLTFFIILLIADIFTLSRAGLLSLISGIIIFEFIYKSERDIKIKKYFLIGLIIFIVIFLNMITIQNTHLTPSTITERTAIWNSVIPLINNFFLGNGLGSYEIYRPQIINSLSTHNYYLEIVFELGILGMIIILAFLGNILLDLYKRKEEKHSETFPALGISILLSMMIFSITGNAAFSQVVTLNAWILLGCFVIYNKNDKIKKGD